MSLPSVPLENLGVNWVSLNEIDISVNTHFKVLCLACNWFRRVCSCLWHCFRPYFITFRHIPPPTQISRSYRKHKGDIFFIKWQFFISVNLTLKWKKKKFSILKYNYHTCKQAILCTTRTIPYYCFCQPSLKCQDTLPLTDVFKRNRVSTVGMTPLKLPYEFTTALLQRRQVRRSPACHVLD